MSMYSIISFLIALLWFYLGLKTLQNNHRDKLYRLFSLVCLSTIFWCFFNGLFFFRNAEPHYYIFVRLAYLGVYFFFPLNLHFYLQLSKTKVNTWLLILNYIPAVLLNLAHFLGYSIFSKFIFSQDSWVAVFNFGSIWIYLYALDIFLYFIISFAVVFRWHKQSKLNKEKLYTRFILLLLTIYYLGGLILTIILPFFGNYQYQVIGVVITNIYGIGMFYLIGRLRFMNLQGGMLAEEIIASLDEMVILLDQDLKIIEVNQRFAIEFNTASEKAKHQNFEEFIAEKAEFQQKIAEMPKNRIHQHNLRLNYQKDGETLITQTNITPVQDRFGDISGFLVISRLNEIKQFQQLFKITDRELEIIELIISGFSYKEVAEKLSISNKTVETHLTNIYTKLNINNKVELIKITRNFNILPH